MTEGQKALRKKLLAKVHQHPFCKEAKKLESWSEFLQNGYGVSSSAMLSINELYNLLGVMCGVNAPRKGGTRPTIEGGATQKQIWTIEKLWRERAKNTSERALRMFIKRTIGVMPLHLTNLSTMDATKVIVAIRRL